MTAAVVALPVDPQAETYPAVELLVRDTLWPKLVKQREKLCMVDAWLAAERLEYEAPSTKKYRRPDEKYLTTLSRAPWLNRVTEAVSQCLFVDGYRNPDDVDADGFPQNDDLWKLWVSTRMPLLQGAIHRDAVAYGFSFAAGLPGGENDPSGNKSAYVRCLSPLDTVAVYQDDVVDRWPQAVLHTEVNPEPKLDGTLGSSAGYGTVFTATGVYQVKIEDAGAVQTTPSDGNTGMKVEVVKRWDHGFNYTPVVRYVNQIDSKGRTKGELESLIPVAACINQTVKDRLLTQYHASWRIITATGLDMENQDEADKYRMKLRQDNVLVGGEGVNFGSIPASDLAGFIQAKEQDVYTLCALAQIPPSALMPGNISNVSAETIAELHAGLMQKVYERQVSFGDSHNQLLLLLASMARVTRPEDVDSEISWQDTSVRSLAQVTDSLVKLSSLGIPESFLWAMVPGVTRTQVRMWEQASKKKAAQDRLDQILNRNQPPQQLPQPGQPPQLTAVPPAE